MTTPESLPSPDVPPHSSHFTCRDREDLVVVEAIKALFGSLPSGSGPLFSAAPLPEDNQKDIRLKARAWKLVSHEAKQALPALPGSQVWPASFPPILYCVLASMQLLHDMAQALCQISKLNAMLSCPGCGCDLK